MTTLGSEGPDEGRRETLRELLLARQAELDIPSLRRLAARVGLSKDTIRAMLDGGARHDEATLQRVAEGLAVPIQRVRAAAGVPIGVREPRVMPAEWNRLPDRQWEALCATADALLDALDRSEPTSPVRHDTTVHDTTARDASRTQHPITALNGPAHMPLFSHSP